jgi:hypothetical protein
LALDAQNAPGVFTRSGQPRRWHSVVDHPQSPSIEAQVSKVVKLTPRNCDRVVDPARDDPHEKTPMAPAREPRSGVINCDVSGFRSRSDQMTNDLGICSLRHHDVWRWLRELEGAGDAAQIPPTCKADALAGNSSRRDLLEEATAAHKREQPHVEPSLCESRDEDAPLTLGAAGAQLRA